jgi:orotate phosphoribosyltransferase
MSSTDILKLFKESEALLTGHFLLTSGRHSDVYYEKFTLLKNPTICTQVCKSLADHFSVSGVQTVVGPTTGGILIAYDVARYLGVEALYAEQGEKGRVFKRGFSLEPGRKVLIVDDVLTTGRSVEEVIALVNSYSADIVGIGLFLDRSGGKASLPYPTHPLAAVSADSWEPTACPLCAKNVPFTQRGSRKL